MYAFQYFKSTAIDLKEVGNKEKGEIHRPIYRGVSRVQSHSREGGKMSVVNKTFFILLTTNIISC